MRILHIITTLQTGGAERLVVDLMPRFARKGHEADVLALSSEQTPFKEKLEKSGIRVIEPKVSGVYHPSHILQLKRLMEEYDVVHTHNTSAQFFAAWAAALMKKRPVMVTTEHSTWNRRRSFSLCKPIDRRMYRSYDSIIGVSDDVTRKLIEFIGEDFPVYTVRNGINLSRFKSTRHSLPPENEPIMITMVAGFREAKDQDTVVRAIRYLPERFRVRFIGDGPRLETVRELARKSGVENRCEFPGLQTNIADHLAEAHIAVQSSHYEGLSLAVVEDMAAGLPIIASDVNGMRLTLGDSGIFFPRGDEKALADEILKLTSSPEIYNEAAEKSLRTAAMYDVDLTAKDYLEIYNSLLTTP